MRYFSIKDLERLSGIKAHTIRAWEIRYRVFIPQRTRTNFRYYTVPDLKHLLDIAFLLKKGYRISHLAGIDKQRIGQRVLSLKAGEGTDNIVINSLIVYMFMEDTDSFENELDEYIRQCGIDTAIHNIIMPFLKRSGILSYSSDSTEIHFAVTTIRRKIIYGIEGLLGASANPDKALLFLPKDEHYDLVLLYINYMLKAIGLHVLYLGTNISTSNLEKVMVEKRPDIIFSYCTTRQLNETFYSRILGAHLPRTRLYIVHPHDADIRSEVQNVIIWKVNQLKLIREL